MMFKRAKVVMLPTNEKANKNDIIGNDKGFTITDISYSLTELSFIQAKVYKLYILSDEEIKEGDWMLHNLDGKPIQWNGEETNPSVYGYKKIIATTDKSLYSMKPVFTMGENKLIEDYIPQLSQSFIEKYIEEYNKGRVIDKVMVEYEKIHVGWEPDYSYEHLGIEGSKYMYEEFLKVNPKDNTITIRKVKDSWTREEVHNLMMQSWINGQANPNCHYTVREKWIEENL